MNTPENENVEVTLETLENIILTTATQTIGVTHYNNNKPPVPWWNKTCEATIRNKKRAYNRYKKSKNMVDLIEFKRLRAIAKRTIIVSKRQTWQHFTKTLTTSTTSSEVWGKIKAIKNIPTHKNIKVLQTDTQNLTESIDIANELGRKFERNSKDVSLNKLFLDYKKENENYDVFNIPRNTQPIDEDQIALNDEITFREVLINLNTAKSKSCGSDNIPIDFIRHLPTNGLNLILIIFNKLFKTNTFPKKWKKAIIIPIPKLSNNQYSTEGYRPISLLCALSKLLEKVINNRLIWYLEKKNF